MRQLLLYGLVSLSIILPWLILVSLFKLDLAFISHNGLFNILREGLMRVPLALKFIANLMMDYTLWNLFWPLFFIMLIFFVWLRRWHFLSLFYINFFLQIGLYFFSLIFNNVFMLVLRFALDRLLLQVIPLGVLIFCISLSDRQKEKNEIIDNCSGL